MKRLLFILAALFATAQSQTIQTIGAPTTTVVSRGNFRTDSIFYLPKRQKLPTDSGAVRYQISDSSVYYWSGSQWRRLGVHIDTAAMLLPYLRDADTTAMLSPYLKESDTVWLSNRINLKLNISDTSSMLNPYLRGSGTANYFPKFDASRSVINSKLYESGTNLLFNTTTPSFTSAGITTIENNATSSAVYTYKIADTIRAYMGYGGANTFDINNLKDGDIRFYTSATLRGRFQTDGTFRLNSLTGTGSRIVVADANGVLSATSSATGLVDTTVLSTRAWRQKGDDSLGAIIATKGSGTVTSVATGYGLSGGTITTTGTISADSAIVASRLRVGKVVDSLALVKQNVLTNPVTGTGTTNYVPKFTGASTIGNSTIFDDGEVKINTTADQGDYNLQVAGNSYISGQTALALVSGNVGVGRVPSNWNGNQIKGLQVLGGSIYGFPSSEVGVTSNAYYDNGTFKYIYNGTAAYYVQAGGFHQWLSAGSGSANGSISWSESMRINTGGELLLNTTTDAGAYVLQANGAIYNTGGAVLAATGGLVGIGTASPTISKLHLNYDAINNRAIRLQDANGVFDIITSGSSQNHSFGIYDDTNGLYRFFIQPDGDIGIGTTSPTHKLDIQGGEDLLRLIRTGVTRNYAHKINSLGDYLISDITAAADRIMINTTGELLLNGAIDQGAYVLQTNGNILTNGTYTSAAPTDGTAAPWRLGSYVTTAPTATGFVQVEINGVKYKLLAATY
jgi:hypothetical protein